MPQAKDINDTSSEAKPYPSKRYYLESGEEVSLLGQSETGDESAVRTEDGTLRLVRTLKLEVDYGDGADSDEEACIVVHDHTDGDCQYPSDLPAPAKGGGPAEAALQALLDSVIDQRAEYQERGGTGMAYLDGKIEGYRSALEAIKGKAQAVSNRA